MTNLLLDAVAAAVLVVLLLRPVILWYFGISRIIKHLASIDVSLRQLPAVRDYDEYFKPIGPAVDMTIEWGFDSSRDRPRDPR